MMKIYSGIQFFLFLVGIVTVPCLAVGKDEPENFALKKPVTGSGGVGQGAYELLTDGNTATDPYLGGPTWVQVDLKGEKGEKGEYTIDTIKLWHYYGDGRTYHDNKVALSLDGDFLGEEVVVFDTTANDKEYPETAAGKTITFKPVKARYIRAWVGGSTANEWSHWVELQAFFMNPKQTVMPMDKLPVTWSKIKTQ